jgi:hypothetical protein
MSHRALFPLFILSAGATLLHAQAMVEFGALGGRAAGTAGGANVGKSVVDAFGKVTQSLSGAANVDPAVKPRPVPAATAAPVTIAAVTPQPKPEPILPPDLTALVVGMDRADMVKKVGKPSMSIEGIESGAQIETCWYRNGPDSVTVILREGKVATISGLENLTAKPAPAPAQDPLAH